MADGLNEQFLALRPRLTTLGNALEATLRGWLAEAGIPTHFVAWRLKSPESVAVKLARPDKTYRQLWDVTDLLGLRIAVSFEDHVAAVSRLIEQKMNVDFTHSSARAKPAGYRSMHYVCAVDDAPHADFRVELQVRTALQHAWAEVEHDLGYKASDAVPEAIAHRFTRVAGLLEIADAEFVSIRNDLLASRDAAKLGLADGVPLDLLSLDALTKHASIRDLDASVASALSRELVDEAFFANYLVRVLRHSGLTTTREVLAAVDRFAADVPAALAPYFDFARRSLSFDSANITHVRRGYSLLFVALLSVTRSPQELGVDKVARLARLYEQTEFPNDAPTAQRVADALLKALG